MSTVIVSLCPCCQKPLLKTFLRNASATPDNMSGNPEMKVDCSRRLNIDPPCRLNIDPGRAAVF